MYSCSVCGKGVLVKDLPKPVRACDCKKPDGTPAAIVVSMEGQAYGKSKFKQK